MKFIVQDISEGREYGRVVQRDGTLASLLQAKHVMTFDRRSAAKQVADGLASSEPGRWEVVLIEGAEPTETPPPRNKTFLHIEADGEDKDCWVAMGANHIRPDGSRGDLETWVTDILNEKVPAKVREEVRKKFQERAEKLKS